MRKPVIDDVEIIEPPIGELTKQKSSLKRTALSGCGCVVFLIILALVGLRLYVGAGPTTISALPPEFPSGIPIYEKDSIKHMTFISGTYKNRSIEIAAFFPKIILSPLLLQLRHENSDNPAFPIMSKSFWSLITTPVGDSRDTVQIEWTNMDADPGFVISYYRKELEKSGYQLEDTLKENHTRQFNFFNDKGVGGTMYVRSDDTDHPGTDYAALTVNIP